MNIVEIKNLNLGFLTELGYKQALYNVSLKLKSGEMHAVVGESGCGKSITAMSILNLLPKNAVIKSGEILFENKNILSIPQKEMRTIRGAKIALIPQDPMTSLNPLFTIGDQITETILCHKKIFKQEAKKLALEALDKVKIPDAQKRFDQYPHELSGGMKQRVVIANTLTLDTELIIADEPTTALDVTIQAQIMSLLDEIKTTYNTSILIITHDLSLIGQYADEISVMYAGNIIENAPTKEFFRNPCHPYSQALLNSLPTKQKNKPLNNIKGAPPSIFENIKGCKFNPRCSKCLKNKCDEQEPVASAITPFHEVKCWLY